jgi:DNA-binding transcriptional regulator YiaG
MLMDIIRINDMSEPIDVTQVDEDRRRRENLRRLEQKIRAEILRKRPPQPQGGIARKYDPCDFELSDVPQTKKDLREAGKVRRKAVGMAIRSLRERLHLSQSGFAEKFSRIVDYYGTVSRWERGALLPQPWKRKKLAAIAREAGCEDLAAIFAGENLDWRIRFAALPEFHELSRTLTLLEICTLNAYGALESEPEAYEAFIGLQRTARSFLNHIAANAANGKAPLLFDSLQREVWMDLINEQQSQTSQVARDSAPQLRQEVDSTPEER